MSTTRRLVAAATACSLLLALSGCETYGEGAGLGAVLGGTAGAVIGNQSGHALEGAAAGAALGALAGVIAHDIKVQRARNRQQTIEAYEYTPTQGEVLQLEQSFVTPSVTTAGATVTASLQYAILGNRDGTPVTETRRLLRGEKVIADLSSKRFTRQDGTWLTTQEIPLPSNLKPGEYSLIQRVETSQSSVFGTATFLVQ